MSPESLRCVRFIGILFHNNAYFTMRQLNFFSAYLLDSLINSIKVRYRRPSENSVKIYDFKLCL